MMYQGRPIKQHSYLISCGISVVLAYPCPVVPPSDLQPRCGGPSMKQSAHYPAEFASWVADQHLASAAGMLRSYL